MRIVFPMVFRMNVIFNVILLNAVESILILYFVTLCLIKQLIDSTKTTYQTVGMDFVSLCSNAFFLFGKINLASIISPSDLIL